MTTFAWLLIGHLVGDWVLQNDWMAKGKRQGLLNLAGLAHFTIYTAAVLGGVLAGGRARPVLGLLLDGGRQRFPLPLAYRQHAPRQALDALGAAERPEDGAAADGSDAALVVLAVLAALV